MGIRLINTFKLLLIKLPLLFGLISFLNVSSQDDTVQIEAELKKISEIEYEIIFNFEIEEDWHLYSQYNPENASEPLKISSIGNEEDYMLIGFAEESETHTEYSENWECDEIFFKEEATVIQRIQILNLDIDVISINLSGQVCSDNCLPVNEDFKFSLSGEEIVEDEEDIDEASLALSNSLKLNLKNKDLLNENNDSIVSKIGNNQQFKSLLSVFLLGFGGGLLAFLTPCVFPLVPLTVSFFTKQSKNKKKGIFNALLYGFFILLIYVLLSVPFHFLDSLDPEILAVISTNVWLNLFFFIIFIIFAGSFFGFYEITLPSSWGNKMDSASDVGGLIGIFFMALTLAIISFSCTGPILGSLLASSVSNGAWFLTVGMAGFGFALALPFSFFAIFPGLLKALPRSGGWMTNIKIMLGFIEVALAFKFLSNADLVGHWNLFYREIFILIWLVILSVSILFLFGFLNLPGIRKVKRVAGSRILLGIVGVGAIVYLAPGLMKKPKWNQSLLSGLAPPEYHTIYKAKNNSCPLDLNCFKDFEEGLAYAQENNKPILLDFTGFACVNCRKMEETVWRDNDVYKILKEDVVIISLYVDDFEKMLPEDEQFDYIRPNGKKKRIKSYGGKWATFQSENFKTSSIPYYVLMSPKLEILNKPSHNTDVRQYEKWLEKGLGEFTGN